MSDIKEEWFKLVLDELRKNNDKVDSLRSESQKKIEGLEEKIQKRLDSSETQHKQLVAAQADMRVEILSSQDIMRKEHARMNDLLAEHMRRTQANEKLLEAYYGQTKKLEEDIAPLVRDYNNKEFLESHSEKKTKKVVLWIGVTATVLGAIATILKILSII